MSDAGQAGGKGNGNGPISTAFALLIIVICFVGVALLIKGLYPADLPSPTDPDS